MPFYFFYRLFLYKTKIHKEEMLEFAEIILSKLGGNTN
jgi:hypothetical protein